MAARTFESFFLVTVPQGRQGQIPYQYPPSAANTSKLPRTKDIIAFCLPDLEEIRKVRSLDFKAPVPSPSASLGPSLAQIGAQVSQIGAQVGVGSGGPSGPPLLVSTSGGGAGGGSYSASPSSAAASVSNKPNFKAEFYTFAVTDAEGTLLYGVVYRCLSSGFGMRYDVGKRYPECLCIITRHPTAVPMFQQVLQQVHSMRLMFAPIEKIEWLLGGLCNRAIPSPGEAISLQYHVNKSHSRNYRYIWPAEGEVPAGDALATLYLFQQLKPKAFVTLLTAMLCERKICFIATDMDKLGSCVQAAIGLLYPFSWQHVFIPVLPAALSTYACEPTPILFGIRRQQLPLLSELPLEDLIYVDLDAGEVSWSSNVSPVPDIYVLPNQSQVVQAAQKLGAEAAKAAEKLDKAFTKGVAFLQKYTGQQVVKGEDEAKPDAANVLAWDLSLMSQSRASNPINWSAKGKPSKTEKTLINDEQQLRDALLVFFVNIAGDASTYLRPDRSGKLQVDSDFYLGSRGMLGDGPALSIFLNELVSSQLFQRFAESRKTQVQLDRGRVASPRGGDGGASVGPFYRCVDVLKQKAETFSVSNIKKVLKAQNQQQQQSQQGEGGESETSGRWTTFHAAALQLTSNSATTTDAQRALTTLVEDSFSSVLLPSILRVVWNRLGDCKGLKWRHAHKSLILLRELLIRGPESILSEMLSNIWVLRTFLEYKPGMGGQGAKVRETAGELFFLVLNGRRFILLRSVYWMGKRKLAQPRLHLALEHALGTSFTDLHRVVMPTPEAPASPPIRGGSGAPPDLLSDTGGADDGGGEAIGDMSAFVTEPDLPADEGDLYGDGGSSDHHQETAFLRRGSSSSYVSNDGGPGSARSSQGRKANWEGFHSGSGAGPSSEQKQWESFNHRPAALHQTGGGAPSPSLSVSASNPQWVSFEGGFNAAAPPKPERRREGQRPISPDSLVHLSTSPPPPPSFQLPPSLPPIEAIQAYAPSPTTMFSGGRIGLVPSPSPYPPPQGVPAYGGPPPILPPQQQGLYGMMPPSPHYGMGGVGPAVAAPSMYSGSYDPFAELEKENK